MKVFWSLNFAVFGRFVSINIQNASLFLLIFEEFHATIGLLLKHLEYSVGLLGVRQNQGEVRQYLGFLGSETFWFIF